MDKSKIANISPMMKQYFQIKEEKQDCIVFFRLGDFYEMFFEDALTASKVLDITLTGRDCGLDERAPMCGVPFHSAEQYIEKLIESGYKVAICEQVEEASEGRGLVRREVVRVVTPGTVMSAGLLDEKQNNFLCSMYANEGKVGLAFVDVTTGELWATEVEDDPAHTRVLDEMSRYNPSEVLMRSGSPNSQEHNGFKNRFNASIGIMEDKYFTFDFAMAKIEQQFGQKMLANNEEVAIALGAVLQYLADTQMCVMSHIKDINFYRTGQFMDIDYSSKRNLEIVASLRDGRKKGTLLWTIDNTVTSMGGRMLKNWLDKPLVDCLHIQRRHMAVREMVENPLIHGELQRALDGVLDIERLVSRIVTASVTPRDMFALANSLERLPRILEQIKLCGSEMFVEQVKEFDILSDVSSLIGRAICDNPPISLREGDIIKDGFNEQVDYHRKAMHEGTDWIAGLEEEERQKTGIKNLKIGFNKVSGYYIEVSKTNIKNVPERYVRKQTLANCERYITGKLKEIENVVLGAKERNCQLEFELFCDVRGKVAQNNARILAMARLIAKVDVICALAAAAVQNRYVMPSVNGGGVINIKNGRHPVVEAMMKNTLFVPNDTFLDGDKCVSIITGPNMAGKSTYMRQVALIVLLAQIGSFVPADSAEIGIVDKIFTRVGASDDLAAGQSTFMVEMSEVANILNNATSSSLLILDEIGRGTSTYDGLSIAWAVVEYIADKSKLGAKTLFATHYHELTELEGRVGGVKNYCVAVKKRGDDIIFLRKIIQGGADDSYGIEVAKLAGVRDEVISRAKEIVERLEKSDVNKTGADAGVTFLFEGGTNQLRKPVHPPMPTSDNADAILTCLKNTDITTITPLEAINLLHKLKGELDGALAPTASS